MKKAIGPPLKLIVTKGPSSGHTSEHPPQRKVNVGRLVNGNKLTIKDPGISSKHLLLQFDSGSGHWTLTDLDSSNGTILNSTPLPPSTPIPLSDADVIKLGEDTAIQVSIELGGNVKRGGEESDLGLGVDAELPKRGRRGCRGRAQKNGNAEIEEESDLGLGVDAELPKRGKRVCRGRVQKNGIAEIEEESVVIECGKNDKMGRKRVKKNEIAEVGNEGGGTVVDGGKLGVIEEGKDLVLGVVEDLGKNEKKVGRGRLKKNENAGIGEEGERLERLGGNELKDVGMASVGLRRVTRSSRRKGNGGDKNGEGIGDVGTGRVTRGGRITRSSAIKEMPEIEDYDVSTGEENMCAAEKGEKGSANSQKRTRNTSAENCSLGRNVVEDGLVVNSEVVDGRGRGNCRRVRKKLEVEVKAPRNFEDVQIKEEPMEEKSYLPDEQDCGEEENTGYGDRVDRTQENICGDGLSNLKKTNLSVLGRLEKMTLGQWLDYIEEYLPKLIVAETEEMISEMRRKAEKFHEFMLQQKAATAGGDI